MTCLGKMAEMQQDTVSRLFIPEKSFKSLLNRSTSNDSRSYLHIDSVFSILTYVTIYLVIHVCSLY